MKKKFYDIIPPEKRSIRNISLSSVRHETKERVKLEDEFVPAKSAEKQIKRRHSTASMHNAPNIGESHIEKNSELSEVAETFDSWNTPLRKNHRLWFVVVCAALGVAYALSIYFSSGTVIIRPASHTVVLNNLRISLKDIDYKVLDFTVVATSSLSAKGSTHLEKYATGTIVLYNTYSTAPQKLQAQTRFVAPNTLVYRLVSPVTIPGSKTAEGKQTAGNVEAKVIADKPGEAYNAPFTDFSIVSYKGTDKYEKIYGRSKTAIAGGYVGTIPNIPANDIASSTAALTSALALAAQDALQQKSLDISVGYVYIPEAMYIEYGKVTQKPNVSSTLVELSQSAEVVAVAINTHQVGDLIAASDDTVKSLSLGSRVSFDLSSTSRGTLIASFETGIDKDSVKKGSISMYLEGTSTITSFIDKEALATTVKGLSKTQAISVVRDIVEVRSIEIITRPWWATSLPTNSRHIEVTTK